VIKVETVLADNSGLLLPFCPEDPHIL